MSASNIIETLRHSLLIKVVSRAKTTRAELTSVIGLAASKIVEALQAQSMSFYIVEGNYICFKQIYYSPALWADDPAKEHYFRANAEKLLATKIPVGHGIVGRVVATGEPIFFRNELHPEQRAASVASTPFAIHSTLTVALKTTITFGALQVLNKELDAGTDGNFTKEDLTLLEEVAEYSSALIHRIVDPEFVPSAEDSARFLARLTELPLITQPGELQINEQLVRTIGEKIIRSEAIFPYKLAGENSVAVVMVNPLDCGRREMFSIRSGMAIDEVSVVSVPVFDALVRLFFKDAKPSAPSSDDVNVDEAAEAINATFSADRIEVSVAELEREDSAPIIQLTNRIIEDAFVAGASDIHIEPTAKDLVVRYRIDGICRDKLRLPKQAGNAMLARLKIMCNLDISERRLPQDGRIVFNRFTSKNIDIDLRVATGPVNHGEKVVMRILDKTRSALPLTELGFSAENLEKYRECIRQPHGMILHCGPTGSGKSMTLYSALGEINTREVNIQTAEDPIEYTLPGLNQTQMNRQIGLTFSRALRSFLRMDPDVILVGEIRDAETAQIAVEASLTGHLLVSTIHSNDTTSTIARIIDLGVEPFNVSSSLVCICAQRLVRRVCQACKIPYEPQGREKVLMERALGWSGQVFKANRQGCPACSGAGFKSRVGIHELLINNEELTEAINKQAEATTLKRIALRNGMKTLHADSMLKVKLGIITFDEALSNVAPDQLI